jgi:hypothetical protein
VSVTDVIEEVVSRHPTTTTFRSPAICERGYVTAIEGLDAWILLGPEVACTKLMTAVYVKPADRVPLCPSVLVTTTFTGPAECTGVVVVIVVLLTTFTLVAAAPPNVTFAPAKNPVPVMVTEVPPLAGPETGEIAVTVGGDT